MAHPGSTSIASSTTVVAAATLTAEDRIVRRRLVAFRARSSIVAVVPRKARRDIYVGERRRRPGGRGMAPGAIRRETGMGNLYVRTGKVCTVTLIAIGVRELVIAVRVTGLARHGCVCAGQRELRRAVSECRRLPGRRVVAGRAGLAETTRHVIRVRCALEIGRMTLIAIGVD
jgi:hypothetical protein